MTCYIVSIKFVNKPAITTQLDIFEAIKKLGTFSIQDQKDQVYILEFKSEFTQVWLEERLKDLAGPAEVFNYTVCRFD
ncbi:MAG: hypothetical protein Q7R35_15905 [Elusimicrobiota bacterium]|nr:hypothetical protein [Elusimicrobiota bacterium]